MKPLQKKGQALDMMGKMAIGIATLAIVLVVTFLIMANAKVQAGQISGVACNDSMGDSACNSTKELQSAVDDIPGYVPLIVIAVIGSILIGLVSLFRR